MLLVLWVSSIRWIFVQEKAFVCEVEGKKCLFQELFMTAQQVFRQQEMDHQMQVIGGEMEMNEH